MKLVFVGVLKDVLALSISLIFIVKKLSGTFRCCWSSPTTLSNLSCNSSTASVTLICKNCSQVGESHFIVKLFCMINLYMFALSNFHPTFSLVCQLHLGMSNFLNCFENIHLNKSLIITTEMI